MLPQLRSRRSHNAVNAGVLVSIVVSVARRTWALTWLPMPAFVSLGGLAYGLTVYAGLAVVVHEASHRMFFLVGGAAQTRAVNPGPQLVKTVLLLVLVPGLSLFHRLLQRRPSGHGGSSRDVMARFVLIWLAVGALTVSSRGWHVLLAQIVGLQVLSALNQVKGALEHGGPIATDPDPLLRSRDTIFVGWPLFWPFFVSIVHFEHPLVPSVSWYALPRFHRALRGVVPQPLHGDVFNRARLRPLAGRIGRISAAS